MPLLSNQMVVILLLFSVECSVLPDFSTASVFGSHEFLHGIPNTCSGQQPVRE